MTSFKTAYPIVVSSLNNKQRIAHSAIQDAMQQSPLSITQATHLSNAYLQLREEYLSREKQDCIATILGTSIGIIISIYLIWRCA